MNHLGSRVTALIDGQLSTKEADRAISHAMACERCAQAIAQARRVQSILGQVDEVQPRSELTAKILSMTPQPRCRQQEQVRCSRVFLSNQSPVHQYSRTTRILAVIGIAVLVGGVRTIAETPVLSPTQTSSVARVASHPLSSSTVLGASHNPPASRCQELQAHGWQCPQQILGDYVLLDAGVTADHDAAYLRFSSRDDGAVVFVREHIGEATQSTGVQGERQIWGSHEVLVVSKQPWHVVWQCGDTVIDVTTDAPHDVVQAVVATFPEQDYDAVEVPGRGTRDSTLIGVLGNS